MKWTWGEFCAEWWSIKGFSKPIDIERKEIIKKIKNKKDFTLGKLQGKSKVAGQTLKFGRKVSKKNKNKIGRKEIKLKKREREQRQSREKPTTHSNGNLEQNNGASSCLDFFVPGKIFVALLPVLPLISLPSFFFSFSSISFSFWFAGERIANKLLNE